MRYQRRYSSAKHFCSSRGNQRITDALHWAKGAMGIGDEKDATGHVQSDSAGGGDYRLRVRSLIGQSARNKT
ncbi:hypothetical protein ACNI3Q_03200 [Sphingomonas sp. FW199]|uniref:hypothetical protein n=1 Tax=Sphingomonas sp. FW199 TaxID=3400217 RepID=UPI003CFB2EF4